MKQTATVTTTYTKQQVIAYMQSNLQDAHFNYENPFLSYGEINCTALGEDACQAFNAYGSAPHYDIPEDFFEWAFEVSQWYEQTLGVA